MVVIHVHRSRWRRSRSLGSTNLRSYHSCRSNLAIIMVQMLLLFLQQSTAFLSFTAVILQLLMQQTVILWGPPELLARVLLLVLVLTDSLLLLVVGDHGPVGVVRRDCPARTTIWSHMLMVVMVMLAMLVMACATVWLWLLMVHVVVLLGDGQPGRYHLEAVGPLDETSALRWRSATLFDPSDLDDGFGRGMYVML